MSSGSVQSRLSAEVLTRLGVGRDTAGVVVAHHHDEPGPDDREQRQELAAPGPPGSEVVLADGAEGTLDVADVPRCREPLSAARCRLQFFDHGDLPSLWASSVCVGVAGCARTPEVKRVVSPSGRSHLGGSVRAKLVR